MSVNKASDEINNYILSLKYDHKFLTDYQDIILKYFMSKYCQHRSMMLFWLAVGRGKTMLSLACGIAGINIRKFKRIIVLSPKSIQDEFIRNLHFYCFLECDKDKEKAEKMYDKYIKYFKFVPYNAYNSYEQFIESTPEMEYSLFIIDEAHLFMKSIIKVNLLPEELKKNNIGNAKRIYDVIKGIRYKKVICLTGTPSAKTPFELVPAFNLISYGKDLFDNRYDVFMDKFIDSENKKIINKKELLEKIDGCVAYVPAKTGNELNEVKATDLIQVNLEMSEPQYKQYLIDYEKEVKELGYTNKKNIYGLPFGAKSSFHAKTFEDSIYWNSELKNTDKEDRNVCKEIIIDENHCPKIIKMYNDSAKIKGLCCFYFRFTNIYGIECMEKCLQKNGFKRVGNNEDVFEKKDKRYVVFSGDYSDDVRNRWKHMFNHPKNKYGEYIKYIILSPSGIVGITLRNVRFLGIGSIEFNYSNIRQILGRCNRLNSHKDLPPEDRTLINKIYFMDKNKKYYEKYKDEIDVLCSRTAPEYNEVAPCIERIIFQDSLKDDIINEKFKKEILIKASITEKIYE